MNLQAVEHLIKVERNECNKKKENEKKIVEKVQAWEMKGQGFLAFPLP